jgi:hypothetical protein
MRTRVLAQCTVQRGRKRLKIMPFGDQPQPPWIAETLQTTSHHSDLVVALRETLRVGLPVHVVAVTNVDPNIVSRRTQPIGPGSRTSNLGDEDSDPRRPPERCADDGGLVAHRKQSGAHGVHRPCRGTRPRGRPAATVRRGVRHALTHTPTARSSRAAAAAEDDRLNRFRKCLDRRASRSGAPHSCHRDRLSIRCTISWGSIVTAGRCLADIGGTGTVRQGPGRAGSGSYRRSRQRRGGWELPRQSASAVS